MANLLDFRFTTNDQLSIVEQAINYAVSITNNVLYQTDLNSPYRILVEAQAYIYNRYLERLADVNYEISLILFRILGFEARAAKAATVTLKFELANAASETKYFRQKFPVRASNGVIFLTDNTLAIPPGAKIGYVTAKAATEGIDSNVPKLTINQPLQQIDVPFGVTNELEATGGTAGESLRDLELRFSEFVRSNGLITAGDYTDFVSNIIPNAVVSVTSPDSAEIHVFASYPDGTPLTATDFRKLETALNQNKMLGIDSLVLNPINTLDVYVEVIGSITTVSEAQTIAEDISRILKEYLVPSNSRQITGNTKGIIIINEVERKLALTDIDFIATIRIGRDENTAYAQNFVFNPINERVRLGKLKVVLTKDEFTGEYEF